MVTAIWFIAFGPLGQTIARTARKGDQLIVEAQVRADTWTDKDGGRHYDYNFIVQGFRFGAAGRATRGSFKKLRAIEGLLRPDERSLAGRCAVAPARALSQRRQHNSETSNRASLQARWRHLIGESTHMREDSFLRSWGCFHPNM